MLHRHDRRGPNIVGISAGYHDSACCLLQGGHLTAAVQEERFSRIKNDKSLPRQSFRYCLQAGGLTISDVDAVAFYEDPTLKLGRQIWMALEPSLSTRRREAFGDRLTQPAPEFLIRRTLGYEGPIRCFEHHLSHAASAFLFSGWTEAAILTVDGVGDWATTTYAAGAGAMIDRLAQVDFPHSLGFFYSTITGYLGFEVNEGEYKVMGLAPLGRPVYVDRLSRLIVDRAGPGYALDLSYFSFIDEDRMWSDALVDLLGRPPRAPGDAIEAFHMDVARSAQVLLEDVLLEKLRYLHDLVPSRHLCMAGGVALNVVANARCRRDGPFPDLFVQPAAGDAGGALGAAAMCHVALTGERPSTERLAHVFLGPRTTTDDIRQLLTASSARYVDFSGDEAALLRRTAEELARGRVIGWYQGRMEFGPRALGARSILADPRHPDMRDRINGLIKQREAFRPFAPAVLESTAASYFALDHASPFMLEVCQVQSPMPLPSITHVDGSARVQTVAAETNPRFAALLEAFASLTGCPVLLNTSFNRRGEPIVCSARDAINCFVGSGLDILVLEDFLIEREAVPTLWHLQSNPLPVRDRAAEVDHAVYTML